MKRAPIGSALRFLPLALLGSLAAMAVVGKLRTRRAPAPAAQPASASSVTNPHATPSIARPRVPSGSGAVVPVTMAHGGPTRRHRSEARGPRTAQRIWRATLRGPIQGQVITSLDEQTLYVATLGGELVALDRQGKERFAVRLGDRAYGAPCVGSDGTVYVGSDAKQFVGVRPDGALAFRLEVDGEADTACAIAGGVVFFAAGSTVYAVRRGGEIAWRFRAKGKVFTAPAVTDDGLVVVGSQDEHVYGLRDGKAVFATDLGADVDGAAVIGDDGALYVGTDGGEVVRLDAMGAVTARIPLGGYVRGSLSLAHDGDVFAGVYGPTPREARLHGDGVLGTFAVPGTGSVDFGVHGGALEDREGVVYFGAQDDAVYAVGPEGVLFRYDAGGDVDAPLTLLGDGALVVASDAGYVDYLAP